MSINSVFQAGISGIQTSQRHMLNAATQIAGATGASASGAGSAVALQPGSPLSSALTPAGATPLRANEPAPLRSQDIVEPLIELRRQEHVFTASAKLVSIADKTLGSLIDVSS